MSSYSILSAKGRPDVCPVCGRMSVDFAGESTDVEGAILVPAECWVCGAEWIQRYVYAGDEEIELPEE